MNITASAIDSEAPDHAEEPPHSCDVRSEAEEEPPGRRTRIRFPENISCQGKSLREIGGRRFFKQVSDKDWNDWTWQFRNRIQTVEELAKFIPISEKEQAQIKHVTAIYPLSITPYYLSLINPEDPDDPIRKQAVPSFLEVAFATMGQVDPLNEEAQSAVSGLVHRYPDRVLMVLTDICPMFCRHCTRKREWKKGGWVRTAKEVDIMLDYIRKTKTIRDVIISGGDPLTLSTRRLEEVLRGLRAIEHVEIIRIGSRLPVVMPQRIDTELCAMLSGYGPIWLNTHFNHPNEITLESAEACDRLLRSGVPVNNQAVLMRDINDSVETFTRLCQKLLRIKVRPYYLFQCDEVQGTEHLRTPVEVGMKIIAGMRGYTSGLAIPTFVVDLTHGGGKVPLQPDYVLSREGDELLLRNYRGNLFRYRNPGAFPGGGKATCKDNSCLDGVELKERTRLGGKRDEDRAVVRS